MSNCSHNHSQGHQETMATVEHATTHLEAGHMIKVNLTTISEDSIYREMQYHEAESQETAMVLAMESLVVAELLKQRAKTIGLSVDEHEQFVETLIEREVVQPKATDDDCLHYFTQNQKKFASPPLLEVKHILLACAPDDTAARSEANEMAVNIVAELKSNIGQFSALAKQYSRCPSAELGGSLGQISKGQTVPEFERQLFCCGEGLVESALESRYGVHIVFIAHKEAPRPLPYDLVADKIRDYLDTKVRNTAIAQYITTLIDDAEIEGFEFEEKKDRQFFHA
ncbi:peptidylprolyl isomerase [Teredinibacter purpureus]|uniref:peptidylprolyl isomerase n=1 Tax=Teredinibacter purpureus TaxID=2731756 RepID=UPI000ABC243C|nr:peptidylprolyl isomerase [Teredinibacter purpureus]